MLQTIHTKEIEPDVFLYDKPKGITSFAFVQQVKRARGAKKAGHAGTLDPLATGLMVVGFDAGTKKLTKYVGLGKEYEAAVRIGERRDTGDIEGEVVEEEAVPTIAEDTVRYVLESMLGTLRLPVPAYSAVKQGGTPLHRLVRGGKAFVQQVRDMEIRAAELFGLSCAEGRCVVNVHFSVASGVYIRSLAEELGRRLGYPATIENLRRVSVGDFRVWEE